MSECTEGFPSLFRIDKLAKMDNTKLDTKEKRQVLIPDINFTCDGSITRWILGAMWKGNSQAHTELQIWRRNSSTENTYTKVNGTNIMVGTENDSKVYEYVLGTPLAFQEGDVLGYFQPKKDRSELDLYLEKSRRLTSYYMNVGNDVSESDFTIGDTEMDNTHYPLIAVRTGMKLHIVLVMGDR